MIFNVYSNDINYGLFEALKYNMQPARYWIKLQQDILNNNHFKSGEIVIDPAYNATLKLMERLTRTYKKPQFNINSCKVDNKIYKIEQETIWEKPFARLVHFKKKAFKDNQPKLLIVAPLAGHYATLCRDTIEGLLPFNDIYITDWISASQVPLKEGKFGLEEYIDYLIEFTNNIGPKSSIMAVCQPTVPVLAMMSYLAAEGHNGNMPSSMILVGGPIDARNNPTSVNKFANEHDIEWFRKNLITKVPYNYIGASRKVYPGYIQLASFIAMNLQRHIGEYIKLFNNTLIGNTEATNKHEKFYDEYLAVMDLPAEFYIETVEKVFQKFSLPKGKMNYKGSTIKPESIKNIGLLVIEGELDDISAVGQTKAAIDLCKGLKSGDIHYHLQKNAGHYGIFSGSKFRRDIVPIISNFVAKYNK